MIHELTDAHLDELMTLERVAFPPELQATRATYHQRLSLGHIALAYRSQGRLCGVIAFSYGQFNPSSPETLPTTFATWSMQDTPVVFDTAFIYNFGVAPQMRGTSVHRALVRAAFARLQADGCHQVIAECPLPSYAGHQHAAFNPAIRTALDSFAAGGPMPPQDLLFEDPHMALYRRLCPCSIIRVIPDFLPEDRTSGGFRAMLFRDLRLSR